MTPVMVALFDDYGTARRTRTELVADGFPTDRVELTSRSEEGQADAEPGETFRRRIGNYFHVIFDQGDAQGLADEFAARVDGGSSAITVHPRSADEIVHARRILQKNGARQVEQM